jgi:hypothetical protein
VTFQQAHEETQRCPGTQLISVADIDEVLVEGTQAPRRMDWIVRACQNRALPFFPFPVSSS